MRVKMLREDKLASMKKIMEYEGELNSFEENHQRLNEEIRMGKASNQLVQACITGLYSDRLYMQEIQNQAEGIEE